MTVDAASGLSQAPGFSPLVLHQEIESAFLATDTFRVVSSDAADLQAIIDQAVDRGYAGQLRNLALDYVISPVVQAAELERNLFPIPGLEGKMRIEAEARIRMRVLVLDAATGEIRDPLVVDVDWSGENGVTDAGSPEARNVAFSQADFVSISREAGRVLADAVLEAVYPVQVIARDGSQVWISRGGDAGYRVGQRLRILSGGGEPLIHPVTGEVLGTRETQLGLIEVTETQARYSIGMIVEEQGLIAEGAIVRSQPGE